MDRLYLGILGFGFGFYVGTLLFKAASASATISVWVAFGIIGAVLAVGSSSRKLTSLLRRQGRCEERLARLARKIFGYRRVEGRFVVYTINIKYQRWFAATIIVFALIAYLTVSRTILALISVVVCASVAIAARKRYDDSRRAKSRHIIRLDSGNRELWYEL